MRKLSNYTYVHQLGKAHIRRGNSAYIPGSDRNSHALHNLRGYRKCKSRSDEVCPSAERITVRYFVMLGNSTQVVHWEILTPPDSYSKGGGGSVLVLISSIIPTTVLHTYVAYVCDKTWMARPAATYVGRLGLGEAQAGSILVLVHRILALSHACFDSLKESPLVVLLVI